MMSIALSIVGDMLNYTPVVRLKRTAIKGKLSCLISLLLLLLLSRSDAEDGLICSTHIHLGVTLHIVERVW